MLALMRNVLKDLCAMGPKPCGSAQNRRAAEYLVHAVRPYCPECRMERFSFVGWEQTGESTLALVAPFYRPLQTLPFLGSGGGHFEGSLRPIGLNHVWNIYSWERYAVFHASQVQGYISARPDGDLLSQTLVEGNCDLPHLILGRGEYALIKALTGQEIPLTVRGFAACGERKLQGINIVAPFRSKSPERGPVIITAHRDTMYNTPGAYDNQSGCAVLVALAKLLSRVDLHRDITLVFTDAEECRLEGARHLAENCDCAGLSYLLNIDGIGRGDEMEIWCGPSSFERRVLQCLIDEPGLKQCYRNPPPPGSDHSPFYNRGVPCAMLTFNDQGIIHTPLDDFNERLLCNMEKMLSAIQKLLAL